MKWLLPALFLGLFLRIWHLASLPQGLHWDEMDTGYQAFSLLKTGKDYFNNPLPLFFHSFADFRTPVFIYSAVPSVAILGLTPVGVRLPAVIYGILSIPLIYIVAQKWLGSKKAATFSSLTMAISPWAIQYSRQSVETISAMFFLLLGVALFRKQLVLSALMFSLSMASYSTSKLFVPLFVLVLIFPNIEYLKHLSKKTLLVACGLGFVACTILIGDTFFGQSGLRAKQLSIFTDPTTATQVNFERQQQQLSTTGLSTGLRPGLLEYVNYNKPVLWMRLFVTNYLQTFSVEYLFLTGDTQLRHSPNKTAIGMLHVIEIVPVLLGLYFAAYRRHYWLLAWLLLSPIPGSLTRWDNPHAARLLILLPALVLLIGLGMAQLKRIWLLGYLVTLSFSGVFIFTYFFANYSWESARPFHWGFPEVIKGAIQAQPNYHHVIVDGGSEPVLMAYLFSTSFPPKMFHALQPLQQHNLEDGVTGFRFDNLFIASPGSRNWGIAKDKFPGSKLLFVAASQDNALNLPNRVNTLNYPDGTSAFYTIEL